MRLILTLSGGGSAVPEKDKIRTLSTGSLSIGRGAGNDWVLPDPDRSLSKTHCSVMLEGSRIILTDTSTNGMFINGAQQATERDSRVALNNGDMVRLGNYTISVAAINDGPVSAADQDQGFDYRPVMPSPMGFPDIGGPAMPSSPLDVDPLDDPLGRGGRDAGFQHPIPPVAVQPRGLDPFDNLRPSARSTDPDDDLFRGIQQSNEWQGASRPDHTPITSQAVGPMRITTPPSLGEIDFDALIGDLSGQAGGFKPVPPPAVPAYEPPRPIAPAYQPPQVHELPPVVARVQEAYPRAPAAPVSELLAPSAAPIQSQPVPPNPFDEPASAIDPLDDPMLVTSRMPPQARPLPAAADPPARRAAPNPVTPTASGAAPSAAEPQAPAPAGVDASAAFRAFLEGAGVAGATIDDSNPEAALRAAGEVFRAMTEGLREVLISRAAIKSEMRLEQTMIASQGNNALKFSVTADDAVAALLTPKRRGYMAPLAATREALSDIKSHEIAVMAGVQTALLALLRRFDPDELEKRLTIGGLSSVLPGARKSRYWDAFRQTYGDITREAEDDFQSVFGRPFAKAYAEQTRKD